MKTCGYFLLIFARHLLLKKYIVEKSKHTFCDKNVPSEFRDG